MNILKTIKKPEYIEHVNYDNEPCLSRNYHKAFVNGKEVIECRSCIVSRIKQTKNAPKSKKGWLSEPEEINYVD